MATATSSTDINLPTSLTVPYIVEWFKETNNKNNDPTTTATTTTTSSNNEENEKEIENKNHRHRESLVTILVSNGVLVVSSDTIEQIQIAIQVVTTESSSSSSSSSFWSIHASLHPKYTRVKNWLWVHERYRNQAKALLEQLPPPTFNNNNISTTTATTTATTTTNDTTPSTTTSSSSVVENSSINLDIEKKRAQMLLSTFMKFQTKIESHSEFEDLQLFKYFMENTNTTTNNKTIINQQQQQQINVNAMKILLEQHSNIRTSKEIQMNLQEIITILTTTTTTTTSTEKEKEMEEEAGTTTPPKTTEEIMMIIMTIWNEKIQPQLERYIQDLQDHLQLEEQTIVGPWLQLTDEQYKKYRTYLSWKYCFMY